MADKHPCTMCIKSFLYISQITKHLLPHSGEKLHKCDQCDKSFGQAGDLKKHMIFHGKEKLQTCIRYRKSFSQGAVLKKHLLTHNGEKLFKCAQCNTSHLSYLSSLLSFNLILKVGQGTSLPSLISCTVSSLDNF